MKTISCEQCFRVAGLVLVLERQHMNSLENISPFMVYIVKRACTERITAPVTTPITICVYLMNMYVHKDGGYSEKDEHSKPGTIN